MIKRLPRRFVKQNITPPPSPCRLVGSIITPTGLKRALVDTRPPCDIFEIRFDRFPPVILESFDPEILRGHKTPILATLRTPSEGGGCRWQLPQRIAFLEKILPHIWGVDLEGRLARHYAPLIKKCRALGKTVILSHHNFRTCPPSSALESRLRRLQKAGADIAKAALFLADAQDLSRLLSLCAAWKGRAALMGMGPLATRSRLELAAAGSALVYGYYDRPAAPGQVACARLRRHLGHPLNYPSRRTKSR
ncbi:MAG: type I 3-dehydroquinate dehydratase [Verrucomicrobiae bacterium]|nr:type I 3-dehydroquinate dehydratase [Verrucomicrobiae bacterium]